MHKTCLLGTVVMAETDGNACVGTERRNDEVPPYRIKLHLELH